VFSWPRRFSFADIRQSIEKHHDQVAKVSAGLTCARGPDDKPSLNPAAYGTHYGINSRGGSVAAAMAIGRMLRKEHAWLEVKGDCISACVLILAGAVDRHFGKSGVVGIHRPYLALTAQQNPTPDQIKRDYGAMLQDIRSYLREMNVSEQLANDIVSYPTGKGSFSHGGRA
jgi:ATP-dependent protease ClpP protease subunit